MKRLLALLVLLLSTGPMVMACELCEEQQPKWLRGVVHGPGPQGMIDYVIMFLGIGFVLGVLFFSVKFLIKPGENDPNHVKYSILDQNRGETYGK